VVALGSLKGILLAVAMALLRFIRIVARSSSEVLGTVEGKNKATVANETPAQQPAPKI